MRLLEFFGSSFILCIAVVGVRVGAMSPRIVGGKTAHSHVKGGSAGYGEYPYQISIRFRDEHLCGASLISHHYVLTAAHCVANELEGGGFETSLASEVNIRAGSLNVNYGGVLVAVSEIKVHPKYSAPNYDIALLKLETPLQYTDSIQPVKLNRKELKPRTYLVSSGWGFLKTGSSLPTELQYVYLNTLSDKDCYDILKVDTTTLFCAKHKTNQGICQGDSGGPGVHNGVLVGVVSFTAGSCASKYPDGFAKISFLYDWIAENSDVK